MLLPLLVAVSAALGPRGAAGPSAGFIAITVGDEFTCGISVSNLAYCWGLDRSGTLGGVPSAAVPQPIPGGIQFKLISAGSEHVCAISLTNKLYCWGSNSRGQLGIDDSVTTGSPVPKQVAVGHYFDTLSAGSRHTCARASDTAATFCWGDNAFGQLGTSIAQRCPSAPAWVCGLRPVPLTTSVPLRVVQAGMFNSCGLTFTNKLLCWGGNAFYGLGDGTTSTTYYRSWPAPVAVGQLFSAFTVGALHSCAIDSSGARWCWGENTYVGELGDGTATSATVPVFTGGPAFWTVSASHGNTVYTHSCGLDAVGLAWCWGSDSHGQLGVGGASGSCSMGPCASAPTRVASGDSYSTIVAGYEVTCAIRADAQAFCWGSNLQGQLGIGGAGGVFRTPVAVISPP